MRRAVFGLAGFASFGAAALLLAATPATAGTTSSVQSGWWNEASAGSIAAPSTTPSNELQVSNGLRGPLSFAAVRFPVPAGTKAPSEISLSLTIPASSSVGTPTVSVCPTTGSWKAGGDQPAGSAPGYDCTGKQANGKVAADGSSEQWTIPITWASAGNISVALLPTPGPQQPFSQQFDDPTPASISVLQPPSSAPPSGFTEPAPVSPSPAAAAPASPPVASAAPAASAATPISGSPAAALPPSLGPTGVSPTTPSSGSAPSNQPSAAPSRQAPGGGTIKAPSRRAGRIMALVILLATGAALFFLAGRPQRPPRKLGSLGGGADTQVVVQPAMGGIGRFARPRIGPPKRI